jgi:hypothetical protein
MLNKRFIVLIIAIVLLFIGIFSFAQNDIDEEPNDNKGDTEQKDDKKDDQTKIDDDQNKGDETPIIPIKTVDRTAPVITLLGDELIRLELGMTYTDEGATAKDNVDGVITSKIVKTGSFNLAEVGTYYLYYNVKDKAGNAAEEVVRTIIVVEGMPEEIIFNRGNPVTFEGNRLLSKLPDADDIGKAWDEYDQKFLPVELVDCFRDDTLRVEVDEETVIRTLGTYLCYYQVTDSTGNTRTTERNVTITDTTPPRIDLYEGCQMVDNSTANVDLGVSFNSTFYRYRAYDDFDGDITVDVKETYFKYNDVTEEWEEVTSINTNIIGKYKITYNVSDSEGLPADEKVRYVDVNDNTGPTVTFENNGTDKYVKSSGTRVNVTDLSGVNNGSLKYQWTEFDEMPSEESFTETFLNDTVINTPSDLNGYYYLWILAKDNLDNPTLISSNGFKLDNTKPELIYTGETIIYHTLGEVFNEPNVTVVDNLDENIESKLNVSGEVDPNVEDEYVLTYTATDEAGNIADPLIITVIVAL